MKFSEILIKKQSSPSFTTYLETQADKRRPFPIGPNMLIGKFMFVKLTISFTYTCPRYFFLAPNSSFEELISSSWKWVDRQFCVIGTLWK